MAKKTKNTVSTWVPRAKSAEALAEAKRVRDLLESAGTFEVRLQASTWNPDITDTRGRQVGYWQDGRPAPGGTLQVSSLKAASAAARTQIEACGLGAGNYAPAEIWLDGRQVAYISYNGRIWPGTTYGSSALLSAALDEIPE